MNVLFVCSRNQWRSPTGEAIFRKKAGISARSAGTARAARHAITLGDIKWADIIFVMEDKHAARIRADFRQAISHKALHILDIPDNYAFMDPELVELLEESAGQIIETYAP